MFVTNSHRAMILVAKRVCFHGQESLLEVHKDFEFEIEAHNIIITGKKLQYI